MARVRSFAPLLAAAAALAFTAPACSPLGDSGWRAQMRASEKPCMDGAKAMVDAIRNVQRETMTLNELKAASDANVTACEANEVAWRTIEGVPQDVRAACLPVAEGRAALSRDMRAQLNHLMNEQDPDGVKARMQKLKDDAKACGKAGGG